MPDFVKLSHNGASDAQASVVPEPQFVNYGYTVVQLWPKRSILHRNNIRVYTPVRRTTNEKFLAFSPSDFSVSILTSSPLLSCRSRSTATTEIWRSIDFSRWLPRTLNTTSGFVFADVLAFRRSKFANKPNFNGQHKNLWLRYNDFWFGKTNVYHIGFLLPVPISTIFP